MPVFPSDLIFDRTQDEVDLILALRQLNEPLPPEPDSLRVIYDWRALNRVEGFCQYMVDYLAQFGYTFDIEIKTDWTEEDLITKPDIDRFIANLKTITTIFRLPRSDMIPENIDGINIAIANDIERALYLTYYKSLKVQQAWKFVGEVYSGEYF